MRYFLVLLGFLALVSCADKSNGSGEVAVKSSGDATTDAIYSELLTSILSTKIDSVNNQSNNKIGETNPYRNGITSAHKALAACLVWDIAKAKVTYKTWNTLGAALN